MRKLPLLICFGLIIVSSAGTPAQKKKGEFFLNNRSAGAPSSTKMNINNVSTWVYNNGNSDITPTGDSGFEYPKGTGKTVFFESGPLWGGSINGYWAVGGSAYRSGLRPGRILPDGTAENINSSSVRIYRVRSDYRNYSTNDGMKILYASEIADEGKSADEIFAQYDLDWKQWPAQYGAPFIDKDKNGIYNPDVDIPGMSENACQTIWYTANDLDASLTQNLYGALPLNIELQATFWAIKASEPSGSTIFKKYKLINKNSRRIDSMYLCMWSDPDMGGGFDDLCGCDTTLNLGFVYNGTSHDDIYGDTPPAAGFIMLQTPVVKGTSQDNAVIDSRIISGYRNLGMTAFFVHSNGVTSNYSDPPQGSYTGSVRFRNWFRGRLAVDGTPFVDPVTGKVSKFFNSGDPVTGTGWIDGVQFGKNDRRFGMVSGEFSMNPNDTQQIIVAQMAAGYGNTDYLNSVSMLKFFARVVSASWVDNLSVLQPVSPIVKVTEMDQELILYWWDPSSVAKCEKDLNNTYKFQGYNIYQLPKSSSLLSEGTLLAAYDIKDAISIVNAWVVDPVKGFLENRVVGFGSNSGICRFHKITQDVIVAKKPLYNFSKYYFGVTSYYVADDPETVPRLIESPLQIITAMPQSTLPGEIISIDYGDELYVNHTSGNSEGIITAKVIDPKQGDGNEYTVAIADETHYNLLQGTSVIYTSQLIKGVSNDNPVIAGAQIHVTQTQGQGLKSSEMISGTNPWSETGIGLWFVVGWHNNLWHGGLQLGWDWWYNGTYGKNIYGSSLNSFGQFHDVVIKFASTDEKGAFNASDANASKGYRFMRGADSPPVSNESAPFIINKLSWGFQEFGLNNAPNIPLAAFDQQTGKRLDLAFLENNGAGGMVDGRYWPPLSVSMGGAGNYNTREVLFILNTEYGTTAKPSLSQGDRELLGNTIYGPLPIMYWIGAPRIKNFSSNDQIMIKVYRAYTSEDKYKFTVPAVTANSESARQDVDKINVFPNPYYGVNPQESNSYQRFVTFTHLPQKATIKIFNVGGQLVKIIEKDDNNQTIRWNLATEGNLYIASGIYVARIDMPELGKTKILKLAVIVEQQYPVHY